METAPPSLTTPPVAGTVVVQAGRARYGPAPPASRVAAAIAGRRPPAALDPGASAGPSGRKQGQAEACPASPRDPQRPLV